MNMNKIIICEVNLIWHNIINFMNFAVKSIKLSQTKTQF